MKRLSPREITLLKYLQEQREMGERPTLAQMARAIGSKSASAMHYLVISLEANGYIRSIKGERHRIELLVTHDKIPCCSGCGRPYSNEVGQTI